VQATGSEPVLSVYMRESLRTGSSPQSTYVTQEGKGVWDAGVWTKGARGWVGDPVSITHARLFVPTWWQGCARVRRGGEAPPLPRKLHIDTEFKH
jgi:hypothetical protein